MPEPRLRVRASGLGGSGYVFPFLGEGGGYKTVKNSSGEPIKAAVDSFDNTIIVPGVTTVNKQAGNEALIQWTANQTAAAAVMNLDYLAARTEEVGYGFLRYYYKRESDLSNPLTLAYQRILNDSSELGTNIHEFMEARVTGCDPPELDSPQAVEMAELIEQFLFENTVEPLATEMTVFSDDYAGTLDGIWKINGKSYLLDIKTSRMIHDSHLRQLAALDMCYQSYDEGEDGGWSKVDIPRYDGYAFIHIRPSDIDNRGNPVPGFCRLEVVDEKELTFHYSAFRGFLRAAQAARGLKKMRIKKENKE